MEKPKRQILVCASFRSSGEAQGVCHKKGAGGLLPYIEEELQDRGMDDTVVTATSCLKVCDRGPALVIQPENLWYGEVESEEDIDAILDALEEGKPAADYLLC